MNAAPLSPNKIWLRALERTANLDTSSQRTLAVMIEAWAHTQPDAPAMASDTECFTYAQLTSRARRYARWGLTRDFKPGTVVALLMTNRPEYLAIWLGLTRIGVVVALINTNLGAEALRQCLRAAGARTLIIAHNLMGSIGGDETPLDMPTCFVHGSPEAEGELARLDDGPWRENEGPRVTLAERALLIFTSGTTGLPKAAHLSHHRIVSWSAWFGGLMGAVPTDRLYDCLPMYHSVGGVAAPCAMLASGGCVVVRDKFSASAFWDDIARWDCTIFQYIGELCRYLLASPIHSAEHNHRLRLACGNGLSLAVWQPFRERFAIPNILEFYAATEGNVSLYNVEGKPGSIGRVPGFLSHRFPLALVRHDVDTMAPERGDDGFCIRCTIDEPGEALGSIDPARGANGRFEGYTAAAETEKKVLRDVFKPGDAWFRTGDLMRRDAQGFHYFVDRIGDTFRWRSENVAASEVAAVIGAVTGVQDVAVYGVIVPFTEGRAGMAAVVIDPQFDLAQLSVQVKSRLPAYARPLFIRVLPRMTMTETFKPKKAALAQQGFEPVETHDPIFVLLPGNAGYVPLSRDILAVINAGKARL